MYIGEFDRFTFCWFELRLAGPRFHEARILEEDRQDDKEDWFEIDEMR